MINVEGISFTLIMTKLRVWATALIGAVLSISVLIGAGPVQAGEVCPNNLKLPTPKSLGLGSGWVGSAIKLAKSPKTVNAKNCKYAAICPMVNWTSSRSGGTGSVLTIVAFKLSKKEGKEMIADLKRDAKKDKNKVDIIKRGKTVTFANSVNEPPLRYTASVSIHNNQRFVAMEMLGLGEVAEKHFKKLTLKSMIKTTQRMAAPCSGRLADFPPVTPLKGERPKAFRNFGAWSLIR